MEDLVVDNAAAERGKAATNAMAPRSGLRQERSRLRQQVLLDAAEAMIAEVGLDGLSMREVGRRCAVPVASVYHYFPSASAMVRALAVRQLSRVSALVRRRVGDGIGTSAGELAVAGDAIIEEVTRYLETLSAAPAIWNALRSNPELRALNRADTIETARYIAKYLEKVLPETPPAEVEAFAAVLLETAGANMMYALEAPAPSKAYHLAALRQLIVSALWGLDRCT